jgi:peptidoglycan/xylan/chitin deacetylase (PgdA/CDA1 family)
MLSALLLFFQFTKTRRPEGVVQKNKENIENVQAPPATSQTIFNNKSETEKALPSAIPIFMYHYIREYSNPKDPVGKNLSVSPKKFEEHLAWLKDNGYQTVFPDFFKDPQPVSFKPVILTFDDGYQDAYDAAFPILQKYQLAGMFYLIVDKIGTPGYLTWDEIVRMQKAGMAFGSHTLTHPDLRNLAEANLAREIEESKEILGQKIGREITDFCYPSGKYDGATVKELQKDNYQTAVTTDSGISNVKEDPFLLKRLRITENTSIEAVMAR